MVEKNYHASFSDAEKEAISILMDRGFRLLGEAKLEDAVELDANKRRRTFRNEGRYDLVLALRKIEVSIIEEEPVEEAPEPDSEKAPKKKK